MLSTGAWILIVIIAAILGAVGGFFIARKYMVNYFEENPPISDDMIRSMMMSMGQKPSEKRVRQIAQSMKKSNKKSK
ncbi:YneF family protein [Aerococcus viridans]|uniref:YneF family protein n=1 Tax=Aerococcus viridans TaxID=1377 RepID=UPI00223C1D2A|nr:YneF family protein [Aerococcus viridans]MCT1797506.1 YneF family protein [Aerococcus viridans]